MNRLPPILLAEARMQGFGVGSQILPSAVGIPFQTGLSDAEWDAEAHQLVDNAYGLGMDMSRKVLS